MAYENLLECLNENNGLIRDWGELKHSSDELNGKFAVVVENIAEAQSLLLPYHEKIDFILHHEEYSKCDDCQKIFTMDELELHEGNLLCNDCHPIYREA